VSTPQENKIFQINSDSWDIYHSNKKTCRAERLSKYYQKVEEKQDISSIIQYLVDTLTREYPQYFQLLIRKKIVARLNCTLTGDTLVFDINNKWSLVAGLSTGNYIDAFDALAMQVPEDLIIHTYNPTLDLDYTSYIHLCSANGWSAEWAINQDFGYIHKDVPNIAKIMPKPTKLVQAVIKSNRLSERIGAISFRTSTVLNRHTENPQPDKFNIESENLFARFERQVIKPFPKANCFLFTIKTYFIDCNNNDPDKYQELYNAFSNVDIENVYSQWFFNEHKEEVLEWMENQKQT
jgi:hypothetical protein